MNSEELQKLSTLTAPVERVKYWDDCHGGRASAVKKNDNLIFEDGSYRETGIECTMCDAECILKDPFQNGRGKVNRLRLIFAEIKLEDAVKEFEAAKEELEKRIDEAEDNGTPPPDESEIRHLRKLQNRVVRLIRKHNLIFDEVNPPEIPFSKAETERRNRNRVESQKMKEKVVNIEV